jgi:(p)ppGpp synthase/HD superfamily hydrolase
MELIEQQIYAQSLTMDKFYHKTDKAAKPYLYHLHKVATMSFYMGWKVASFVEDNTNFAMKCFIVGMLHDIIEDTNVTDEELSYFDEDIISSVRLLTHNNQSYIDYFNAIINSGDKVAIIVKYCDACHNSDVTRYDVRTKELRKRCRKYKQRANLLAQTIMEWK